MLIICIIVCHSASCLHLASVFSSIPVNYEYGILDKWFINSVNSVPAMLGVGEFVKCRIRNNGIQE